MGFMKRAFLCVTQKKGKSALLFILLLIMATFVLTGLSIGKASDTTQKNLRQALGGRFQIVVDYSDNNRHRVVEQTDTGMIIYTKMPITDEMISRVAKTSGIKTLNATTEIMPNLKAVKLFTGSIPIKEEFRSMTTALVVSDTETNSNFSSGSVSLAQGRHIVSGDTHVAVISKDLAEKNGLAVGDALTYQNANTQDELKVTIIGLFEPKEIEDVTQQVTSYQKIQNKIFTDLNTATEFEKPYVTGYNTMDITVEDPSKLDAIVSELQAISSIDWSGFVIEKGNQSYEAAASSLERLDELVTTLLIVIAVVSAIILSLILTMWAKSRIHETGVFLSVGIRKSAIVGQYLTEVLLIAVLAFGLSFFSSNAVANQIGNSMLQQQDKQAVDTLTDNGKAAEATADGAIDSSEESDALDEISNMDIRVSFYNMIQLYLMGFSIIILSVGMSSITVMRLKPREILSKMS
ncbi:FtsX-like permease family protein [compost metagenome]